MRHTFSDTEVLHLKAKNSIENGTAKIRKWWSDKYKLPPTHNLFEDQSMGEVLLEMYEDMMMERDELAVVAAKTTDKSVNRRIKELSSILSGENINDLADDSGESDDLIDKWEREIEAGETPDLSEKA